MQKKIPLSQIRIDGDTQPRESIDTAYVDELAEHADELPPAIVYFDGRHNWLADGFHRYHALQKSGKTSMMCDVVKGTQRDAILFCVGANVCHGLRRTNADKRRAVEMLLNDEEWAKKSLTWIAEKCCVSVPFVSQLRKDSTINVYSGTEGKDGRTINTENIGRKKTDPEDEPPTPPSPPAGKLSAVPPKPPAPAVAKDPWQPFVDQVGEIASDLRSVARKMSEVLKYDASNKQLKEKYAYFFSHSGTIGAVNAIIRNLEQNVPAEECERAPGFINVARATGRRSLGGKAAA